MRLLELRFWCLLAGVGLTLGVGACAGTKTTLDTQAHDDLLAQDRKIAQQGAPDEGSALSLSIDEAMKRGLAFNLDARVAALEALSQADSITLAALGALPKIETSGGFTGRDNQAASSSLSILSGRQSLEPSISSERNRRLSQLEMNWNLLEAALALADAQKADDETKIVAERYRKVIQNIQRDVYNAYWRAAAFENAGQNLSRLKTASQKQINNVETAQSARLLSPEKAAERAGILIERQRTLADMEDQLGTAGFELKGLLSVPMGTALRLTTPRKDISQKVKNLMAMPPAKMEEMAIRQRPEIREEILKQNIAVADLRREVMRSFPGLSLFAGLESDDNRFLENQNWANYSVNIVQNLTNLITLPVRFDAAKNKEEVTKARRQALIAATIAQVSIARAQLRLAAESYELAQRQEKFSTQKLNALMGQERAGLVAGEVVLQAIHESTIETLRAGIAHAQLQGAYAGMVNTLGQDLIPSMTHHETPVKQTISGGAS